MAIGIGNRVEGTGTLSLNCTGSNRLLIVTVGSLAGDASAHQANAVTSVTYAGDALTRIRNVTSSNTLVRSEIWYLINPDSGTNNIVVTHSDPADDPYWATAICLSNTHQSSPIGSTASGSGEDTQGGSIGTAISTETGRIVISALTIGKRGGDEAPNPSPNGTSINEGEISNSNVHGYHASARLSGQAGSTTFYWNLFPTHSVTYSYAHALISVKEYVAENEGGSSGRSMVII